MKACVLLFYLYAAAMNPDLPVHFDNVTTPQQAVAVLNECFPDWGASYKPGEFDCSEMSALVCLYLNACGIEAEVKTGCNWEKKISHAWVEADGTLIEATTLTIPEDTDFYDQFARHHYKFCKESEFYWWNSTYIRERCSAITNMMNKN